MAAPYPKAGNDASSILRPSEIAAPEGIPAASEVPR